MMHISDVLIRYRAKNSLTQKQMSGLLGISQVAYHKWESGRSKVQMAHYCRIARVCNVRLMDILPEEWREKIWEELGIGLSRPEDLEST